MCVEIGVTPPQKLALEPSQNLKRVPSLPGLNKRVWHSKCWVLAIYKTWATFFFQQNHPLGPAVPEQAPPVPFLRGQPLQHLGQGNPEAGRVLSNFKDP